MLFLYHIKLTYTRDDLFINAIFNKKIHQNLVFLTLTSFYC